MQFEDLIAKAIEVRAAYEKFEKKTYGKTWTKENIAEGFVGDVGDLMKLVLAKQGIREIENVDKKMAHELADCLWSIIILAELYSINLEESFMKTMNDIKARIENKSTKRSAS